jgi:hypothetical protein
MPLTNCQLKAVQECRWQGATVKLTRTYLQRLLDGPTSGWCQAENSLEAFKKSLGAPIPYQGTLSRPKRLFLTNLRNQDGK